MMVFDGLNWAQAVGLSNDARAITKKITGDLVKKFKISNFKINKISLFVHNCRISTLIITNSQRWLFPWNSSLNASDIKKYT